MKKQFRKRTDRRRGLIRRLVRSTGGATALEFAIIFPVFIAMTMGLVEFGRLFWVQVSLRHAVEQTARDAMAEYELPGNVRALRHAIERATILSANESIDPDDLQLSHKMAAPVSASVTVLPTVLNLDQMERAAIEKSLHKHAFNISHAAKELGLTRASLYRRMEKHGI